PAVRGLSAGCRSTRYTALLLLTPVQSAAAGQPLAKHGRKASRHRIGAKLLDREFHFVAPVRILGCSSRKVLLSDFFGQVLMIDQQKLGRSQRQKPDDGIVQITGKLRDIAGRTWNVAGQQ